MGKFYGLALGFILAWLFQAQTFAADGSLPGLGTSPVTSNANDPNAPSKSAHIVCVAAQDTDNQAILNLLQASPSLTKDFSASQYALVRLICKLAPDSTASSALVHPTKSASSNCDSTSGVCLQSASAAFDTNGKITLNKTSSTELFALFRNPNRRLSSVVNAGTLGLGFQSKEDKVDVVFASGGDISGLSSGINIGGEIKETYCQVYVSGAQGLYPNSICTSGGSCTPAESNAPRSSLR